MARLCVLCSQVEPVHPEVGFGYVPHSFRPAERRRVIRRMDDRVRAVQETYARAYEQPALQPERRLNDRRQP